MLTFGVGDAQIRADLAQCRPRAPADGAASARAPGASVRHHAVRRRAGWPGERTGGRPTEERGFGGGGGSGFCVACGERGRACVGCEGVTVRRRVAWSKEEEESRGRVGRSPSWSSCAAPRRAVSVSGSGSPRVLSSAVSLLFPCFASRRNSKYFIRSV